MYLQSRMNCISPVSSWFMCLSMISKLSCNSIEGDALLPQQSGKCMSDTHWSSQVRFSISVGKTIHLGKVDTWMHYFNFSDCAMQLPSWHNHNPVLNWVWGGQRACWSTVSSNKLQQSGHGASCVGHINSVQLLQTFYFLFRAFISQNCIRNKYTDPMSKEMTSGIPEILFWERGAQKKSTLKHWVFPWCGDICPVLKCLWINRLPPHHFYSRFYQFEYTA